MNLTVSSIEIAPEKQRVPAHWAVRASLLWQHRRMLGRITGIALIISAAIAFLIPKEYKSGASIMPPDQRNSSAMMLAALVGRSSLGSLGTLAGGLLGGHTTSDLFINLLESGTVRGHLIDRFDLRHVYHTRYRYNAAKRLARHTKITEDKKSGVITIEVEDTDPIRARDMAQTYLDELNKLLTTTSTSSARQERIFIEHRLHSVQNDLEQAQLQLSAFSSKNSTVDIREQTRAMVDSGARLQGELLLEQSSLQALRQIYGDGNVRVKETRARIAALQQDLVRMTGTSAPLSSSDAPTSNTPSASSDNGQLYPPLRQLPRLAVPYADLYRRVKVQETVYELLTQQYEMARIEEAKDIPVISVIDAPWVPEKKSFPPRIILTALLTCLFFGAAASAIILRESWSLLPSSDPRKLLASEVFPVVRHRWRILSSMRSLTK
jgi:capsule polysaccharide export protein KpsE/RkpR